MYRPHFYQCPATTTRHAYAAPQRQQLTLQLTLPRRTLSLSNRITPFPIRPPTPSPSLPPPFPLTASRKRAHTAPASTHTADFFLAALSSDVAAHVVSFLALSDAFRVRCVQRAAAPLVDRLQRHRTFAPTRLLASQGRSPGDTTTGEHFADLVVVYTQSKNVFACGTASLHPKLARALLPCRGAVLPSRAAATFGCREALGDVAVGMLAAVGAERFGGLFFGLAMFAAVATDLDAVAMQAEIQAGGDAGAALSRRLSAHAQRGLTQGAVEETLTWLCGCIESPRHVALLAGAVAAARPDFSLGVSRWLLRHLAAQQREEAALDDMAVVAGVAISDAEAMRLRTFAFAIVDAFSQYADAGTLGNDVSLYSVSWTDLLSDEAGVQLTNTEATALGLALLHRRAPKVSALAQTLQAAAAEATAAGGQVQQQQQAQQAMQQAMQRPVAAARVLDPRDFMDAWAENDAVLKEAFPYVLTDPAWRDAYSDTLGQEPTW